MEKVGIVGLWTGANFGAVLTAWALYNILERNGYHPYLIDFLDGINADSNAGRFIRKRCRVRTCGNDFASLEKLNAEFDIFMVGSDQCWRGGKEGSFIKQYGGLKFFLNFTENHKKRISYATSCGVLEFEGDAEERELTLAYLRRFHAISMRERRSAKLYSHKLGREVEWTVDPVFLVDKEEFAVLATGSASDAKPFVLGMYLDVDSPKYRLTKKISSRLGCESRIVLGGDFTNACDIEMENMKANADIGTFLGEILRASYIVTDSYHCLCFALIFHKPMTVIVNFNRGEERFYDLLDYLKLTERIVSEGEDGEYIFKNIDTDIDWQFIDSKISERRSYSMEWLLGALREDPIDDCKSVSFHPETAIAELEDRYLYGKYMVKEYRVRMETAEGLLCGLSDYCEMLKGNIVRSRGARVRAYIQTRLDCGLTIAIRGGGDHTIHLLELMEVTFRKMRISIRFIIDKRHLEYVLPDGCEEITPDLFYAGANEVTKVILSSSKYADEMKEELQSHFDHIDIIDPYDAFIEDELLEGQGWYDI